MDEQKMPKGIEKTKIWFSDKQKEIDKEYDMFKKRKYETDEGKELSVIGITCDRLNVLEVAVAELLKEVAELKVQVSNQPSVEEVAKEIVIRLSSSTNKDF